MQYYSLIVGTGTGKTLSFVLPLLEKLSAEGSTRNDQGRPPLVLTMAPTRELAIQVFNITIVQIMNLLLYCKECLAQVRMPKAKKKEDSF